MTVSLTTLLQQLKNRETVEFSDVIQVISDNYHYQPQTFKNGTLVNEAGTNEGSCKIFAFAQLHNLSAQETLNCFGTYYRDDVIKFPQGTDHGNIRNFI